MRHLDVIIVGAGPAGASAAKICAENGLQTLLLEKASLPRVKPCAGGVSAASPNELDFPLPPSLIERKCVGMRAVLTGLTNDVTSDTTVATMVTRAKFDNYLTSKAIEAGAQISAPETCLELTTTPDGVIVRTTKSQYRTNIVIGSDGVYSKVATTIRPKFTASELRFCIIAEVPMAEAKITALTKNLVELHYGYIDLGYAWIFPKKDYLSFGIGGAFTQSKQLQAKFIAFLKLHGITDLEKLKMQGCLIPISSFKSPCYSDRIMLTGDAAGFVDCFSGEGIRYAIASGKMAAWTCVKAHRLNDFSKKVLQNYQTEFYSAHKKDLLWSGRFSKLAFKLPNLVFNTLLRDKTVILKYYQVMAGQLSFAEFGQWVAISFPGLCFRRLTQR